MSNQDLLITLIGLGFIIIVGIIVVAVSVKKSGDKQKANEFLEGLSNELKNLILKVIRSFDIADLDNLNEDTIINIETSILKEIYETCWNYVKNVAEKNSQEDQDFFTQAVLALLENKDFVEKFIRKLIESESLTQTIQGKAEMLEQKIVDEKMVDSVEEDTELQEEFSDQDKYIEELKDEDQTHGEVAEEPTEEELSKLNPQVDEPEDLDPDNDISIEVVEDTTNENEDIYYDKSGRPRSKKTGKWVKVNK